MLGELCGNVFLDTSSSNSWAKVMPNPLTLRGVFERSLQVYGPKRLLFGTDSTVFPRGWRADIFEEQTRILSEIGISREDAAAILGGNLSRLLSEAG
jgi:predicted TIM-barrel fold metal-dependent hydrolase